MRVVRHFIFIFFQTSVTDLQPLDSCIWDPWDHNTPFCNIILESLTREQRIRLLYSHVCKIFQT